jgi:hypothetical protein
VPLNNVSDRSASTNVRFAPEESNVVRITEQWLFLGVFSEVTATQVLTVDCLSTSATSRSSQYPPVRTVDRDVVPHNPVAWLVALRLLVPLQRALNDIAALSVRDSHCQPDGPMHP